MEDALIGESSNATGPTWPRELNRDPRPHGVGGKTKQGQQWHDDSPAGTASNILILSGTRGHGNVNTLAAGPCL